MNQGELKTVKQEMKCLNIATRGVNKQKWPETGRFQPNRIKKQFSPDITNSEDTERGKT